MTALRPRVLVLTTDVESHGGVQYASRLFVRALGEGLGADVTLVTVLDRAIDAGRLGVPVTTVPGGGSRLRTGLNALRHWLLRRWDAVMVAHINLASLLTVTRRLRSAPTFAWIHGVEAWAPVGGVRRRGVLRFDRLLCGAADSRDRSLAANPWMAALPWSVCPLGLWPGEPVPPGPLPNGVAPPFALCVGRMSAAERYKGHEELIRVWPRIQRARPGMPLVIVGDGDDRPRLEALARDTSADVRFLGRVDDAARDSCLAHCRCFLMPSRGEGFGLVFLEAMQRGRPVLAGDADAGREIVADGVTGRTVNPADAGALEAAVLDVSGPRAESYGAAGRQRFLDEFTFERFRDRFASHVRGVIASARQPQAAAPQAKGG